MKPSTWLAISFGFTLALVVGVRLSMMGLLLVGALLLSALLLCPLFALRWVGVDPFSPEPQVRVERPPAGGLGGGGGARPALGVTPRPARRGGWSHLHGADPAVERGASR